jgi:hypothetical protein
VFKGLRTPSTVTNKEIHYVKCLYLPVVLLGTQRTSYNPEPVHGACKFLANGKQLLLAFVSNGLTYGRDGEMFV